MAKQQLGQQSHVTVEKTERGVTSSRVSTLGMRFFCAGRFRPLSQGRSTLSTSRYRNEMALTAWPDYPRLKVHIWVGLLYCLTFTALSFVPWAAKSGVSSGAGLLLFAASIAGQFIVAASVYAARIRVRELLAHASAA